MRKMGADAAVQVGSGLAWEVRWRNADGGLADRTAIVRWNFRLHLGIYCPAARPPPSLSSTSLDCSLAGPAAPWDSDGSMTAPQPWYEAPLEAEEEKKVTALAAAVATAVNVRLRLLPVPFLWCAVVPWM